MGGVPCTTYIGENGAGHYVKMVHNGIEYGDMQMICEAYALMKGLLGLKPAEMSAVFTEWNHGILDSFLIEITADILQQKDPVTKKPFVDIVLDTAGQKGTGKWTSTNALDMGVPAPTVAEAVFARCISAIKEERVAASKILKGPAKKYRGSKKALIAAIHDALYCSKICSYAQGFQLMREAQKEYNWKLNFGEIAQIWRGGCIIRAAFLQKITEAYAREPAPGQPAPRSVLQQDGEEGPGELAQGGRARGRMRRARPRPSARRSPTTTATAPPGCRPTSCRASATISAPTPTSAPTSRAGSSSTWTGRSPSARNWRCEGWDRRQNPNPAMLPPSPLSKRRLHEPDRRTEYWAGQAPGERLKAVEVIRQSTSGPNDPQSAFPRFYRVTRKARG